MADPFIKDIYGKTPFDIWSKQNENTKEYVFRTETIKRYILLYLAVSKIKRHSRNSESDIIERLIDKNEKKNNNTMTLQGGSLINKQGCC